MPIRAAIRNLLAATPEVAALATGGIYTSTDVGRDGLTRTGTPEAYDSNGYMLPSVWVVERSDSAWGGIDDMHEQVTSTRKMLEIYFYDDGDLGYNTIDQLRDLVYGLLHGKFIGGSRVRWTYDANDLRDEALNNAALIRSDYAAIRIRQG